MSTDQVVARLAGHRLLADAPRAELEWLARHGSLQRYRVGERFFQKDARISRFYIVLAGRLAIHVEERHGRRRVMEWTGGDFAGKFPYSRLKTSPGDSVIEEETEALVIDEGLFLELVRECPYVTATCVHVMLDRARHFNSAAQQDEKMLSLGRLAAGVAHEINNPASAAVRSAQQLERGLSEVDRAALAFGALALAPDRKAVVEQIREQCLAAPPPASRSPIEQADREDAIADWLRRHGADEESATALADTGVALDALEPLASALADADLDTAVRWIAAGCWTQSLAHEIERAASRIHQLVSSIKRFSYMDRAQVPEPIDVGQLLSDTVMMLASRARSKSIDLRLETEPGLPMVTGFGGELNQVWMNLIDNAIDAAPEGGNVTVSAKREPEFVVVRVTDDGPGIPDHIRPKIFDPFFTTKPPGQGTGLGLDIVQRIVRGHRAELDVTSRPGRTEFRVGLPLDATDGAEPTTSA